MRPIWWYFAMIFFSLSFGKDSATINLLFSTQGSTTPDTRPTDNPFISHTLDSSIPLPMNFEWSVHGNARPLTYTLYISEDSIFDTTERVATNFTDTMFSVWNLKIGTPYYWKIVAKDSLKSESNSPIFTFTTSDAWPRMIYIDGTTNVRDIGGRRNMDGSMIKQGIFYRSAELNVGYPVTQKGLEQLMKLGIVCEIDLRDITEHPQQSMQWLRRYVLPLSEWGGIGISSYVEGLVLTADLVSVVFKELADTLNYPMILHCQVGADRTGTIVGLLEALLGCSEAQMGQDYIWTSLSKNGVRDTDTIACCWHKMVSYLKSFDKQNASVQAGAWNYLQTIGMTVEELIAIRKIFLSDDRQPYPALSVKPYALIPQIIQHHPPQLYFLNSSRSFIVMKKGVRQIKIFDLSGKKIWEFSRTRFDTESELSHYFIKKIA